jgi:osmotically-inducible protein OsmY
VQSWQECDNAQTGAFGMQSYRGKGPRGYARSDERIKEDVCERLSEHHYIDATDVSVEVKDGVVTLEGAVGDRWQKYQAEDLTDTISGVKDISNRLTVKRADPRNADNSRVAQTPAKGN